MDPIYGYFTNLKKFSEKKSAKQQTSLKPIREETTNQGKETETWQLRTDSACPRKLVIG